MRACHKIIVHLMKKKYCQWCFNHFLKENFFSEYFLNLITFSFYSLLCRKILWHEVTPAADAEAAGLFYNCQTALHLKQILTLWCHIHKPQPLSKIDNYTVAKFVKDKINNKRSKSWDVHFHWLTEIQTSSDF